MFQFSTKRGRVQSDWLCCELLAPSPTRLTNERNGGSIGIVNYKRGGPVEQISCEWIETIQGVHFIFRGIY